ncbi:hypothetical protein [Psittacicella hinzii]|uniref:hypothetical protein n=1 Tax=Psittacicella hinzii TaxID=2028575 RepID=UPI001CA6EA5C|nr:hypothetical protein [Psittacicella hinzii]
MRLAVLLIELVALFIAYQIVDPESFLGVIGTIILSIPLTFVVAIVIGFLRNISR